MTDDIAQPQKTYTAYDLPFRNLVLTGFLGSGKSTIGRTISQRLKVDFFDIDDEIEMGEVMSIAKIRELYGEQRLRALEHDYCRRASLMRRAVVVVPGTALLDVRNYNLFDGTSEMVILYCDIGEGLRRLHRSAGPRYRDSTLRARMIARMHRQYEIVRDTRMRQLDTTHLSVEKEAELLIELWATGTTLSPLFRYGPPAPIQPPTYDPVGLSTVTPKQADPPPRQSLQ